MARAGGALVCGEALHADIALNIGARGIRSIQRTAVEQADVADDLSLTVCRNKDRRLLKQIQEQVCIIGRHSAVAVQIGNGLGVEKLCARLFRRDIQQQLAVFQIDPAVVVIIVIAAQAVGRSAVHSPRHSGAQRRRQRVQVTLPLIVEQSLRKQFGTQRIGVRPSVEVVDGETEIIAARACGVVAKFSLDLAVSPGCGRISLHFNVGVRRGRRRSVDHACTLLNDRVICVVFIVDDRLCRGHHDRLGQRAVGQIAAGKALGFNVLLDQCADTGDLRRSHRGAAHEFIVLVAALHTAGAVVQAVERVDIAAGRSDLRLQRQIARNAPGTEFTDGLIIAVEPNRFLAAHSDLAGIIQDCRAVLCINRLGLRADQFAVVLCDRHARDRCGTAAQVHVD